MEAIRFSEMSVHTRTTRRHIPENDILHSHRRENLKFYNNNIVTCHSDCRREFGLVIGFTNLNNLQVVTTINYYTIIVLHSVQSLHTSLQGL
jgi:hypothetical protein